MCPPTKNKNLVRERDMSPTSRQTIGFIVAIIIVGAGAAAGGYYIGHSPGYKQGRESMFLTRSNPNVAGMLEVFEWSGYEVPELWDTFKVMYPNVEVKFSFFVDEAEALTKLQAGYRPDIAHPCYASIPRWYDAGVIEPLDIDLISNWKDIFPDIMKDVENGTMFDGEYYFCPTDWGYSTVIYRPDLLEDLGIPKEDWDTYSLLFDYRSELVGKIMLMDAAVEVFPMAAIAAGVPIDHVWNMNDTELDMAEAKLLEGKPMVKSYWQSEDEVAIAMRTGEIVAANIWGESFATLRAEGVNVTYSNPEHGRILWTCGFSVIEGFKERKPDLWEAAHEFMNAWLDPVAGAWLIENYAYGSPSSLAPALVEDVELMEAMGFESTEIWKESIVWEYTPNEEEWILIWSEYRA